MSARGLLVAGLAATTLVATGSGAAGVAASRPAPGAAAVKAVAGDHAFIEAAAGDPLASRLGPSGTGGVDVFLNDDTHQVVDEARLGLVGEDATVESYFGASVAVADLDRDSYSDLVIGAPGQPLGSGDSGYPGRVDLVFGTSLGLSPARAVTLGSPGAAGDRFGAAVAISGRNSDSGPQDLWVGAPGATVGGAADAGAVYHYVVAADGTLGQPEKITQGAGGVGGAVAAEDRFGEVLAASVNGVVVGEPHEDVAAATDAGAIQVLSLGTAGTVTGSQDWNQDSAGVPGKAESGDGFGTSVTNYGQWVGVPGEDLGTTANAGTVQRFTPTGPGIYDLTPGAAIDQDSAGVPGAAEAGDRFGASLAPDVDCFEEASVAIGAPGEDVGSIRDAGSVTLLDAGDDASTCPPRALRQGKGVPGSPEAGDRLGAALGSVSRDPLPSDPEGVGQDTVLIGVPGEDIGTSRRGEDVGRIYLGGIGYGFPGGPEAGDSYGTVISQ